MTPIWITFLGHGWPWPVTCTWALLSRPVRRGWLWGTRFFPLFFCLHAAGNRSRRWLALFRIRSFCGQCGVSAGWFYCLLRKSGVDRWLAVAGCAAVLAGSSVQDAFLTIREDGLAAALNVWGVALCAGEYSRRRLYISAVLFALAFATKETSVFGAAGLILALLVSKKVGDAVRLGIATAIGYAAVIVTMYAASGGRAFEGLRLTLATGSGFYSLLNSPITMAEAMNGYREEMILLVLSPHGIRVDASSTASPCVMVSVYAGGDTGDIQFRGDCGEPPYRFVGSFGRRVHSLDFRSFVA